MKLLSSSTPLSPTKRAHSQRGNAVMYILMFGVLWFSFFTIKDWIANKKAARYAPHVATQHSDQYQDDPYLRYSSR